MNPLNQLLSALQIEANVFHNGQYCGMWAVDISGSGFMTFHVVTRGSCTIEVDGSVQELVTGDTVFMPTDSTHRVSNLAGGNVQKNAAQSITMRQTPDGEATGLVCGNFVHNHPVFNNLVKQLPDVIVVKSESDSATATVLQLLLAESERSGLDGSFLLNRLSDCLFYLLVRDNIDIQTGVLAATTHPKLRIAMAEIHSNTAQRINVEKLAEKAAMSRSSFAALFKEVVGHTPLEYSIQWKMTQAYRWLADDGISTYDAAQRCGYESEASFSKAFKKVIGTGPGLARK